MTYKQGGRPPASAAPPSAGKEPLADGRREKPAVPCNGSTLKLPGGREISDTEILHLLQKSATLKPPPLNRETRLAMARFRIMVSEKKPFTGAQAHYLQALVLRVEQPPAPMSRAEILERRNQVNTFWKVQTWVKKNGDLLDFTKPIPPGLLSALFTPAIIGSAIDGFKRILGPYGMEDRANALVFQCAGRLARYAAVSVFFDSLESRSRKSIENDLFRRILNPNCQSYMYAGITLSDLAGVLADGLNTVPSGETARAQAKIDSMLAFLEVQTHYGSSVSAIPTPTPGSGKR